MNWAGRRVIGYFFAGGAAFNAPKRRKNRLKNKDNIKFSLSFLKIVKDYCYNRVFCTCKRAIYPLKSPANMNKKGGGSPMTDSKKSTKKARSKLNGSVDLLADALRQVIRESMDGVESNVLELMEQQEAEFKKAQKTTDKRVETMEKNMNVQFAEQGKAIAKLTKVVAEQGKGIDDIKRMLSKR